jgi:hypothetical protein
MFTKQVSRPVGSLDPQIVAPRPSRSNDSRKDLFTCRFEVFVPFRSEVDRAADVRGWLSRVRTGTPPKQRLLASTGDHLGHQATSQPVAALSCMTAATDWPRIGPATHCAMTQEDEWRREANPQVDDHLMATPQVAEIALGNTLKVETRVQIPLGLPGNRTMGRVVSTLVKVQTRARAMERAQVK